VTSYFSNPIFVVWCLLAGLTGVSWVLGDSYRPGDLDSAGAFTIALMVLAFFKVRLVILHFMEAKAAPLRLRILVEGWVIGVCLMVLVMYFRTPGAA
jgi:hypothetical protein